MNQKIRSPVQTDFEPTPKWHSCNIEIYGQFVIWITLMNSLNIAILNEIQTWSSANNSLTHHLQAAWLLWSAQVRNNFGLHERPHGWDRRVLVPQGRRGALRANNCPGHTPLPSENDLHCHVQSSQGDLLHFKRRVWQRQQERRFNDSSGNPVQWDNCWRHLQNLLFA